MPNLEAPTFVEPCQPIAEELARRKTFTSSIRNAVGRTMLALGLVTSVVAAESAVVEPPAAVAEAQPGNEPIHSAMNTNESPPDGVYFRGSPSMADTDRVLGHGVFMGDQVQVHCHTRGEPVGAYGNRVWEYVTDISRPTNAGTPNEGFLNTHYIDDGLHANQVEAGVPECGAGAAPASDSRESLQPAETVLPFTSFNRNATAAWALAHAKDTPPNDGSCTIFVSRALWEGGMPQTAEWNNNPELTKQGVRNGSDDAWAAQNYVDYMRTQPFAHVSALGRMSPDKNSLPEARLGDVIGYDWDHDKSIDHLAVITGFSGEYPLVSGWSEDEARALPYAQRGWTYSAKHGTWLQLERDDQGHYPQFDMEAYLVHFRNDSDLNITPGN